MKEITVKLVWCPPKHHTNHSVNTPELECFICRDIHRRTTMFHLHLSYNSNKTTIYVCRKCGGDTKTVEDKVKTIFSIRYQL